MICWPGSVKEASLIGDTQDDLRLLAVGKFPNTVSGIMQWAILTAKTLCNKDGLRSILIRLDSLHSLEKGNPGGFLNHNSSGLN